MMKQFKKLTALILMCAALFCTAGASHFPLNDVVSNDFAAFPDPHVEEETSEPDEPYENLLLSDETAAKSDEEILEEILADPDVSDAVKAQLLQKEKLYQEALDSLENGMISRRVKKYFVDVEPIMQEDDTRCGPATIQMVLNHKGVRYDSQSKIQNAITYNGHTDLELIMNYLNSRQNNRYARKTYQTETELLAFLDVAAQLDLPVIHTAKATRKNVNNNQWPYKTSGHFFILCGRNDDKEYVVSDPFYYPEYVSDVDEEGRHKPKFDDLFTVSTNYGKTDEDGNPVAYIGY